MNKAWLAAQNEAERTNAAIGEALTTGTPDEPPADPFYGLTASQMDSMTLKEVEEHCSSWKMENTWKLAREVSDRIHDEPGPGKHDFQGHSRSGRRSAKRKKNSHFEGRPRSRSAHVDLGLRARDNELGGLSQKT